MKRNKRESVVRYLLTIVSIVTVLCGCENESAFSEIEVNPGEESSEPIPISVSVSSIEEYYGGAVTRGGSTSESIRQPLDSLVDSGYDIVTTYESLPLDNRVQTRAPMANMKFRVLAYKNSVAPANFVGQCQFQTNGSGIATSMQGAWLILPGTYTFVCYSNGTNADIPVFSSNATSLSISQNTDFMTYTKTNVVVMPDASGKFVLSGIQFNRMMAQLDIRVQTKGFPSNNNISSCTATVTGLSNNTATWGIGAADLIVAGTGGSINLAFPNVNAADISSTPIRVFPQSNRSLYVTLPTLRVSNAANYDSKVKDVVAPNRQFVRSGNYRITLKVEPNSIPACAYNWAKANLSGNGTIAANQTDRGAYFGWNTTSTGNGVYNSGNYNYNNDPCKALPPAGTWYTPSDAQLTNLKNCSPGSFTNQGKYFGSNAIFLPAAGYRTSDGSMYVEGASGNYWARSPNGSGYGYGLYFDSSLCFGNDAGRYYGQSVRCVKGM